MAVQCKCWKRDVENHIELQLKAGKQLHSCCVAWVVTTSNFTRQLRRRVLSYLKSIQKRMYSHL
nr:restriction endonuclease [Paenibacillus polymyxa]